MILYFSMKIAAAMSSIQIGTTVGQSTFTHFPHYRPQPGKVLNACEYSAALLNQSISWKDATATTLGIELCTIYTEENPCKSIKP